MSLIETESIILKTYNLAEADKIVVLLTREHGLVRGVAKGAKRLKSKFGSGLEPFSNVNATYFEKESAELVSIQKIEILTSNFAAASEPLFLQKFSYLGDLLTAFMPPHDPNETLFRMVKACVEAAAANPDKLAAVGVYFQVWLLKLSGYLPDWSNCVECRRLFEAAEQTSLRSDMHLLCHSCGTSARNLLAPQIRSLIGSSLSISPGDFVRASDDTGELNRVSEMLRALISRSLGREVAPENVLAFGN